MDNVSVTLTEDMTFPFGGYAKAGAENLIEGDGVRFAADLMQRCYLVEAVDVVDAVVHVILTDRSVHVASVAADLFHRPFEGMAADPDLHSRTFAVGAPVWIRL
jgi:hypothetical protein